MNKVEQKLDQIVSDLVLIKDHLKIVADKDMKITDLKSSLLEYEDFATNELKLNQGTITNQLSVLARFLYHTKGMINKETVQSYLDTKESDSWKSNQLKALRRYIRDFLNLGNWINNFEFSKTKAKIKQLPTDSQLLEFVKQLRGEPLITFLLLYCSGLRIGEVTKLKVENLNFETNSIDASQIHEGKTKHSWVSFFTNQVSQYLKNHIQQKDLDPEDYLFSIDTRTIQNSFKLVSENLGMNLTPHVLRSVFTEKCTLAKIHDKYIDAFCGRTSPGIIAKHYSDYSPEKLRIQYNLVESLLILG